EQQRGERRDQRCSIHHATSPRAMTVARTALRAGYGGVPADQSDEQKNHRDADEHVADLRRHSGDASKAQYRRDERDDEEDDGVVQHVRLLLSLTCVYGRVARGMPPRDYATPGEQRVTSDSERVNPTTKARSYTCPRATPAIYGW